MGSADGSDARRMAGRRKPVVDRCTDAAPLNRRVARPMMPRDEEDDAVAGIDRLLEGTVNHGPGALKVKPVKIDHPVGRDGAGTQFLVPAAVERRAGMRRLDAHWCPRRPWRRYADLRRR